MRQPAIRNATTYLRALIGLATGLALSMGASERASAQIDAWQSHTAFREVKAMAASSEAIWVATQGGVFGFDIATSEISILTTTNGLYGIDAEAIAFDHARNAVWIGYADGVIDRLDVASRTVATLLDIKRADQFPSRKINNLRIAGDSVLVSTDFGVVIFDPVGLEVIDSYSNLGSLNPATVVNDVLFSPLPDGSRGIWVASRDGVVRASLNAVNLREPSEWTVEEGLPVAESLSLARFQDRIHVGTVADGFSRNDDGTWHQLRLSGGAVESLTLWGEKLAVVEAFSIVTLDAGGARTRTFTGFRGEGIEIPYAFPRSLVVGPGGDLWVGDVREGVLALPGFPGGADRFWSNMRIVPSGPQFSLFTDLDFDDAGLLWAAGGIGNGSGFYQFDGATWNNYTARFYDELEGRNGFDFIHAVNGGSVWASSQGDGLVEVTRDGVPIVYDQSNSTLLPANATQDFIRVRGIASEQDGGVWILNQFSPTPLNHHSADGIWSALPALRGDGLSTTVEYDKIFVDAFDQKWILPLRNEGLIVWDTNGTPDDNTDDRLKYLRGKGSGGRGLPDENVTAWTEDRSGRVWIGTERGLGIYFVPNLVISDDPSAFEAVWPIDEDRTGFLLRDLFVNDLAVDAADRKWIASTTGAWLIDPEGTKVLKHFSSENSPLFSDNVVSVSVDTRTGKVYFATDRGMLSYQDDPVEPETEAGELTIFPNPVRAAPDGSLPQIFISGLVSSTDVRITTPTGSLVAMLAGQGGRIRWDGRDRSGAFVPSGVYIVIARGLNEEGVSYGKIAVIR